VAQQTLPVVREWFAWRQINAGLVCLWEPHVHSFVRANMWLLRGADRDVLVDAGLGVADLKGALAGLGVLGERPIELVLTHTHPDHMGSAHQFPSCGVHAAEEARLRQPLAFRPLLPLEYPAAFRRHFADESGDGYNLLIDAVPWPSFDPHAYAITGAVPTRILAEGDEIHLGDEVYVVLHLPGHSPGSIGLWNEAHGALFAGDVVYDHGALIDQLPDSSVDDYLASMERLLHLPVEVVYAGHGEPFGRELLMERASAYIDSRG
jgi:glyoxylase-like metal-dependent hydrolase (beta-lactamase superfamily II)